MSSCKDYFFVTIGREELDLTHQCLCGYAAFPAPNFGHDTIGADLVAAFLYLHHRSGASDPRTDVVGLIASCTRYSVFASPFDNLLH